MLGIKEELFCGETLAKNTILLSYLKHDDYIGQIYVWKKLALPALVLFSICNKCM